MVRKSSKECYAPLTDGSVEFRFKMLHGDLLWRANTELLSPAHFSWFAA
jgi:hypothetical protein